MVRYRSDQDTTGVSLINYIYIYILSISVLAVSHILVERVIKGAKLEDNTFS